MHRTGGPRDDAGTELSGVSGAADGESKPEVEPDSWRELTEFVDKFDEAVFGVLAEPDIIPEGF